MRNEDWWLGTEVELYKVAVKLPVRLETVAMRVAHSVGVTTDTEIIVGMVLKAKVHKPHLSIKVTEFFKRKQVQPTQV